MDENKLLEECITVNLTPLQTLLLSETVIITSSLVKFLLVNNAIQIDRFTKDNTRAPESEQVGKILLDSAVTTMYDVRRKIWESGEKQIGEKIPEELIGIIGAYSSILEEIANEFINMLRKESDE